MSRGPDPVSLDVGDSHRIWYVYRDETGAQAEPLSVALTVRSPDGTATLEPDVDPADSADVELAAAALGETLSSETGLFRATLIPSTSGVWWYRWHAEGSISDQREGWLDVRRRRVPDPASS